MRATSAASLVIFAALALALTGTLPPGDAGAKTDPSSTHGQWREIPGGPNTTCALGTPFSFFVHDGNPRRVLIFFGGGGACWSAETCGELSAFDAALERPRSSQAIFDFAQPANPFRDFIVVFVPHCTGDVNLGARNVTYTAVDSTGAPSRSFVIHHVGNANVRSALAWVYRSVPNPEAVLVIGSSAGAGATPYYAGLIAEHYPHARIAQLGESAGGYRTPLVSQAMAVWGAVDLVRAEQAYRDLDSTSLTLEAIYTHAGRAAPSVRFAQLNSAEDAAQLRFLAMVGVRGVPFSSLLSQNLAEIRKAVPTFRSYTAPGTSHSILGTDAFYTLRVDGVLLRDWVAALAEGRPVKDVGEKLLEGE